ncbi:hypothetical protein [Algoriphagus kandeliae]|uniref:hypothetical protein n=1 Tax=Algoriphagus kandeliae TaxID=2562278 RepID=UPI001386A4A5|nr:hypothetical protein [Algoriphagus kandeliae]
MNTKILGFNRIEGFWDEKAFFRDKKSKGTDSIFVRVVRFRSGDERFWFSHFLAYV